MVSRSILFVIYMMTQYFCLSQIEVFEKNNRVGLKSQGEELIPPIYDKLGWSTNEFSLLGEVTGYYFHNGWGLVNIKNKPISDPIYYSVEPFDDNHIIVSVKGRFSNRLFYGLVDQNGEMVISSSYFQIEREGTGYKISSYENGSVRFGYIDDQYNLKKRPIFREIIQVTDHILALQLENYNWQLVTIEGNTKSSEIDHFDSRENGIIVRKNGKYGVLDKINLSEIRPLEFKRIDLNKTESVEHFPEWHIMSINLDSTASVFADSVKFKGGVTVTYSNGAQELILNNGSSFTNSQVELKMGHENFMLLKDLGPEKWSLTKYDGTVIVQNQDSIAHDGMYFFTLENGRWNVYNRFGRKLTLKGYDELRPSKNGYIPARRDKYWGMLDFQGQPILGIKFDEIGKIGDRLALVKYIGDWGAMDYFGSWKIRPQFDSLLYTEEILIGERRGIWTILNKSGRQLFTSTSEMIYREDYIELKHADTLRGLVSLNGKIVAPPRHEKVGKIRNLFFTKTDRRLEILNEFGDVLIDKNDGLTSFEEGGNDHFKIQKDGKFGFIDSDGRIKIANRYDSVKTFNSQMAAFYLRGGWGYINETEEIIVQPNLTYASNFDHGYSIGQINGLFGVLDNLGNWKVSPRYKQISHLPNRGYVLLSQDDLYGLANSEGQLILTPQFQNVQEVSGGLLIINRKGKFGIMDDQGHRRIPFDYASIEQREDFLLLKKLPDH